jgi:hypothetical protein
MAWTPVLPEAAPLGPLSAQLRRPRPASATGSLRRRWLIEPWRRKDFPPFCRPAFMPQLRRLFLTFDSPHSRGLRSQGASSPRSTSQERRLKGRSYRSRTRSSTRANLIEFGHGKRRRDVDRGEPRKDVRPGRERVCGQQIRSAENRVRIVLEGTLNRSGFAGGS